MERLNALLTGRRSAPLTALVLGLLSALGFAPLGWWPLTILAFLGLLLLVERAPGWRRAAFLGWAFGLGQFVLGLNWIATAFTYQAKMPAWLGWVAVVLLSIYLAAYPAIAAVLGKLAGRRHPLALPLALAGGWIVGEWLRSFVFTGFAWNPVGVALVDTPLRHLTVWVGTYGLSGIVLLLAAILFWLLARRWRPAFATAALLLLALLIPRPQVIHVTENLTTFDVEAPPPPPTEPPTAPSEPPPPPPAPTRGSIPAQVRIVQPNIDQADKWSPGFADIAAQKLTRLATAPIKEGDPPPTLIFWPEAAIVGALHDERDGAQRFVAAERGRAMRGLFPMQTLVTGGTGILSSDGRNVDGAINSVFVIEPGEGTTARYDKAHLVPYGEYLALRWLFEPLGLSRLAPGDIDFVPGPGPRTLELDWTGRRMGVQLCYEIIFSGQVVDRDDRPDFLFNPSNDAWFGAWGPPQHLAQARLRATEEGLPVVRSTPTGISAMIAADGAVLASLPMHEEGVIDAPLPPPAWSLPLFARLGNFLPLAFAALLIVGAVALVRRQR